MVSFGFGLLFVACIVLIFFLFGCTQSVSNTPRVDITSINSKAGDYAKLGLACFDLCKNAVGRGVNLSSGPCLGAISSDWVCDVVHFPRGGVDNLPENQCSDFLSGKAHHFVEVDVNCSIISIN